MQAHEDESTRPAQQQQQQLSAPHVDLVSLEQEDEHEQHASMERAALVRKQQLDHALSEHGRARAEYWQWFKPVLERPAAHKPLVCKLLYTRGGEGVCGKLLKADNPAKAAKEHYTWYGCKGLRLEAGQAALAGDAGGQPASPLPQPQGVKRSAASVSEGASSSSSSKQQR